MMRRYLLFFSWLFLIWLLGVVENTVSVPVIALGLLFFLVSQQQWWLRLVGLIILGITWGVSLAVSPTAFVVLLVLGNWLTVWLSTKLQRRASGFWVSILVALLIGILREAPVTLGGVLLFLMQAFVLWMVLKRMSSTQAKQLKFFIPPQSTDDKT